MKLTDMPKAVEPVFSGDSVAIAFAAGESFVPYFSVLLSSLICHASDERNYDILLLEAGITAESEKTLLSMVGDKENISLRLIDLSSFKQHFDALFTHMHMKAETWYRLILPEMLPGYKKILYLDVDMVLEADPAPLYDTDVEGYLLAAVRDPDTAGLYGGFRPGRKKYMNKVMKMKDHLNYFQAGTILFNLEEFRNTYTTEEMMELAAREKWDLMDQDVLNILAEGKVRYIDMAWNVMYDLYRYRKRFIIPCGPPALRDEYLAARKKPFIIHYAGPEKPWTYPHCDFGDRFWHYAAMSPFHSRLIEAVKTRLRDFKAYPMKSRVVNFFRWIGIFFIPLWGLLLALKRFLGRHKRMVINFSIFFAAMFLTFIFVLKDQDLGSVFEAVGSMSLPCLLGAVILALANVSLEGVMFFFLLRRLGRKANLFTCIGYSFVGFFYSGITPSATGGQPMQLYHMNKDGFPLSDSSVILMSVAFFNKLVVVILAVLMLIFCNTLIMSSMGGYYFLFFVGIVINTGLVVLLLLVMCFPQFIRFLITKIVRLLFRIHILGRKSDKDGSVKTPEFYDEKTDGFISGYKGVVKFILSHRGVIGTMLLITFLQRCTVFVLTGLIYLGLGLSGTPFLTVVILQAAVTIASDMLPIPGAQGITELVYANTFGQVFLGATLGLSTVITRGISFYLVLFISILIVILMTIRAGRAKSAEK